LAAGELEILEMLWREGSVTIREAQDALALGIGYTTVQTRLERLVKKCLAHKSRTRPAVTASNLGPYQWPEPVAHVGRYTRVGPELNRIGQFAPSRMLWAVQF
jgi:hypothetical protein